MEVCSIAENPAPRGATVSAIRARDGWTLRAVRWDCGPAPVGTVAILPGRAEFIEKYFEVISELLSRNFAVAILDWRGQGRSGRLTHNPLKGHIGNFRSYELDLDALVEQVLKPFCPSPWFALGHSMGAAIALAKARTGQLPFARMVLTAPMIDIFGLRFPRAMRGLARGLVWLGQGRRFVPRGLVGWLGLSRRVGPGGGPKSYLAMLERFEGNALTSDRRRHARTKAIIGAAPDLAVGDPTIGWVHAAMRLIRRLKSPKFPRSIRTPILIVAAGADRVVDSTATEEFASRLKSGKCITLAHALHEILMERDPFRELFWAAFDAFVSEETAKGEVPASTGIPV